MITAMVVEDCVATLDNPMYRPDAAYGMMSVISAQSTARNALRAAEQGRRHDRDGDARRARR